jgi:hypothetical protein
MKMRTSIFDRDNATDILENLGFIFFEKLDIFDNPPNETIMRIFIFSLEDVCEIYHIHFDAISSGEFKTLFKLTMKDHCNRHIELIKEVYDDTISKTLYDFKDKTHTELREEYTMEGWL